MADTATPPLLDIAELMAVEIVEDWRVPQLFSPVNQSGAPCFAHFAQPEISHSYLMKFVEASRATRTDRAVV